MPTYRVTVRHGRPQRYHVLEVEAADVAQALRDAADRLPAAVVEEADLVEIRTSVDPEGRSYLGEE